MDAKLFQRVFELFDAASKLPAGERDSFLQTACADPAVLSEVRSLLAHDAAPAPAVRTQAVNAALSTSLSDFRERDPEQIGQFRIVRRLGHGGMGVVYLAEQAHPQREVALKIIRPALASPDLLRRFEHETQVLARLRHPGIAQLYETGWAETGGPRVPYFAMEYAPGLPLTEYAHQHGLAVGARVELLIRVCEAVQHAHQRGVIHRDLKPANILVVDERTPPQGDAAPPASDRAASSVRPTGASSVGAQPKVLDFGVARCTDADVKMTTVQTDVGQLIGTLAYMSPEQIDGDPLAIDTRSDVYALGVILYELLTGSLPHGPATSSLAERIRVIKEVAPPRLSAINRRLRGDLDTIAHKALEKAPARRYASAAELGADLQRYLASEPIQARPPTLGYQIAKFTTRNRALVSGAAIALLALVGGAIGTTWQAIRATREQHRAEGALAESQRQQGIAKAVNNFMNEILTAGDLEKPTAERDEHVSELLARAEQRVAAGSLGGQPEVEADVRSLLAKMSRQLGRFDPAIAHLQRALELRRAALGAESAGVARALADLGDVYVGYGRFADAEPCLREALTLAEKAFGPRDAAVAAICGDLAQVLAAQRDIAGAVELNRRAIDILAALGPEKDALRAILLNNQGNVHRDRGAYAEAEPYYRDALQIVRARLGSEHMYTATFLNNLALTVKLLGRTDEALPLYREALAIRRKLLPPDHIDIAESLNNLSSLLGQTGKVAEAEPLAREALEILKQALPAGHVYTGYASRTLGNMLLRLSRFAEAEPHLLAAYEIFRQNPPQPGDPGQKAAVLLADLYEKWNAVEPAADRAAAAAKWRSAAAASQPAATP